MSNALRIVHPLEFTTLDFGFFFVEWMGTPAWMWLSFLGIVMALLAFDLGVLHRDNREIEVRESLLLSAMYISLGLAFGGWVWWQLGAEPGMNYLTGFVVEKTLALDNVFVIALIFTYFMGTGRWLEETSTAYSLPNTWYERNQKIKYGILPGILISFLMILGTGCLGAIADPATAISLDSTAGVSDATLHFAMAVLTWIVTMMINFTQYIAIARNSGVVEGVLAEVRRIRLERGLPVD